MIVPIWLSQNFKDDLKVLVLDEQGMFKNKLTDNKHIFFTYSSDQLEAGKESLKSSKYDGILHIPSDLDLNKPKGISYLSENNAGIEIQAYMQSQIERLILDYKYQKAGFDRQLIKELETKVSVATINVSGESEKESNTVISSGVGLISGVLIYMFIFIYGAQVMRGVIEEKSNRIIEVMISSVKPMQLMMGKVIGIAMVGLTQFVVWIGLTGIISTIISVAFGLSRFSNANIMDTMVQATPDQQAEIMDYHKYVAGVEAINFPVIIGAFLFFFLAGYLFYGALFAAIGAAVDNETDTQQFMIPITIPLVLAFMVMESIITDPNGSTGFWFSIVPFTSPIVMMMRLPFMSAASYWQLALSMVLLIAGFVGTIWLAGKIYRIGILMHGKKVNYKEIAKWLRYSS